jgi:hypothetical protein
MSSRYVLVVNERSNPVISGQVDRILRGYPGGVPLEAFSSGVDVALKSSLFGACIVFDVEERGGHYTASVQAERGKKPLTHQPFGSEQEVIEAVGMAFDGNPYRVESGRVVRR